jgi:hypothetical protein
VGCVGWQGLFTADVDNTDMPYPVVQCHPTPLVAGQSLFIKLCILSCAMSALQGC